MSSAHQVHAEVDLGRKPVIGEYLDRVEWDDQARHAPGHTDIPGPSQEHESKPSASQAKAIACSSTDGYLYVHSVS